MTVGGIDAGAVHRVGDQGMRETPTRRTKAWSVSASRPLPAVK